MSEVGKLARRSIDIGKSLEKPFRTGKSSAKAAAEEQKKEIARQRQIEAARLAEGEDDLARRRQMAAGRGSGRSLLIRSQGASAPATTSKLGG